MDCDYLYGFEVMPGNPRLTGVNALPSKPRSPSDGQTHLLQEAGALAQTRANNHPVGGALSRVPGLSLPALHLKRSCSAGQTAGHILSAAVQCPAETTCLPPIPIILRLPVNSTVFNR